MQKIALYVIVITLLIIGSFAGGAYYGRNFKSASADVSANLSTAGQSKNNDWSQLLAYEVTKQISQVLVRANAADTPISINDYESWSPSATVQNLIIPKAYAQTGNTCIAPGEQAITQAINDAINLFYPPTDNSCREIQLHVNASGFLFTSTNKSTKYHYMVYVDTHLTGTVKTLDRTDCSKLNTEKIDILQEFRYGIGWDGKMSNNPNEDESDYSRCQFTIKKDVMIGTIDKNKCRYCKKATVTPTDAIPTMAN